MSSTRHTFPSRPVRGASRIRSRKGFTLVETMMATLVFTMMTLGVYTTLIKSYQLSALNRCKDDARAILRTYADQFQRLETTWKDNADVSHDRWLFNSTGAPTGRGLVAPAEGLSDQNVFEDLLLPNIPYLEISLGGEDHATPAKVTREVHYINASTGDTSETKNIQAAGYMLRAIFQVKFNINQREYTQRLTVLRVVP